MDGDLKIDARITVSKCVKSLEQTLSSDQHNSNIFRRKKEEEEKMEKSPKRFAEILSTLACLLSLKSDAKEEK